MTTSADIDFFNFSSSIFKENHVLVEESNPSKKSSSMCSSMKNVGILKYSLTMEGLKEILTQYFFNKHLKYCESVREFTKVIRLKLLEKLQLHSNMEI